MNSRGRGLHGPGLPAAARAAFTEGCGGPPGQPTPCRRRRSQYRARALPVLTPQAVSRVRPSGFLLLLIAMSVLAAGLVLAREVTWGPGLRADAVGYIGLARNLLAGEGFTFLSGRSHTNWPPLYPLLLAAASLGGVLDPLDVAGPLNAAVFGLTVFVVGSYLHRRLRSRFLAAWAAAALALSIPLATSAWAAMTESTFILLLVATLIQADRFLAKGRTPALAWAAIFGSLTFLIRYPGIAAPLTVGLALLCQPRAPLRRRAARVAGVALAAAVPMAAWLLHNYLNAGYTVRYFATTRTLRLAVGGALAGVGETLWVWSYLDFLPSAVTRMLLALLALAAAALLTSRLRADRRRERTPTAGQSVLLFGGFALLYVAVTVVASTAVQQPWQFRYLAPAYPPLLVSAAFAFDWLLGGKPRRSAARKPAAARRAAAAVLMAVLALWTAGQAVRGAREIRRLNSDVPYLSYLSLPWADSAVVRRLREHPIGGKVYSNVRGVAYLYGDGIGTWHSLPKQWPRMEALLAAAPDGAYVVWFDAYRTDAVWDPLPYDYGVAQLLAHPGLQPAAALADGAILMVNAAYRPSANAHLAAQEALATGALGEPAARAAYDLYLGGAELVYRRESCNPDDTHARFFLHLFPVDAADLPAHRRQHGFDNLDFDFPEHGVFTAAGACLAVAPLPGYPKGIERIRTGQWIRGQGQLWVAEFPARAE